MSIETISNRQFQISTGQCDDLQIPKFSKYAICNLRGGVGKSTLSFNLSYLADKVLVVDTCPQGNLSFFYDNEYYSQSSTSVRDLILPHLIPGLGSATRVARSIVATNPHFSGRDNFFVSSASELYLLPSILINAISQVQNSGIPEEQKTASLKSILFSLRNEIMREMQENHLDKCLIDTSPFFAGATQLSWYAADALIIPIRTDQQSIKSFELLIKVLTSPESEFRKYLPQSELPLPRIQMVVLTHCGWSTIKDRRNIPNQQTMVYLKKIYDIISRHRNLFSTDNPENHLLMLDDFLGSGRISSVESKPIEMLCAGHTKTIDRVRVKVNRSVEKCKNQLRFIKKQLWD